MSHELRDNGDLVLGDSEERPLAKLQTEHGLGNPFLAVRAGEHPLDTYCGQLTPADLEQLREWADAELGMLAARGKA